MTIGYDERNEYTQDMVGLDMFDDVDDASAIDEEPKGLKYDEDPYIKVDLSLVPWDILGKDMIYNLRSVNLARRIWLILNSEGAITKDFIGSLINKAREEIPITELAVALGYGCCKYERNNWKKGFGNDPHKFLRACLRHCYAYCTGHDHDREIVGPYTKGNTHAGAILFSLMVAQAECKD